MYEYDIRYRNFVTEKDSVFLERVVVFAVPVHKGESYVFDGIVYRIKSVHHYDTKGLAKSVLLVEYRTRQIGERVPAGPTGEPNIEYLISNGWKFEKGQEEQYLLLASSSVA